jgi:cytochrome d ubiquinol oxidase subunit II
MKFGVLLVIAFSAAGIWLAVGIDGFTITSAIDAAAAASPITKTVTRSAGAWLGNYSRTPWMILLPALAYLGTFAALGLLALGRTGIAFIASSIVVTGVIATAGATLFPFIVPSSNLPNHSLTVWDSTSSHRTLGIMLAATLIFMPLIIFYTSWAYKVMAGKVTEAYVRENEHQSY